MRSFYLLCALLLLAFKLHATDAQPISAPEPHGIAFKVLAGEETALKALIGKWKTDELARQGGKFGSHGWWPWGLLAFDYDNDGDMDLLAQHHAAPQSLILRNEFMEKGTLTFVAANPELGLPGNALAGCFKPWTLDIDGDGFLDLLYNDAQPNTIFFNRAGKKFEPMGMGFGQLDGVRALPELSADGYPVAGHAKIRYVYDASARKFKSQAHEDPLIAKPPEAIAEFLAALKKEPKNRFLKVNYFERLNLSGSGKDLAYSGFASYGGSLFGRYLTSDKDGKLTDATEQLGLPKDSTPILFADLNGDGYDDVLVVGAGMYLSDGKGKYAAQPGRVTEYLKNVGAYVHKVVPVDFNRDGRMDLVLNNCRLKSVALFENLGGGAFKPLNTVVGWDADPVAVCDINNDGLLDVCVGGPEETVTILLNQTAKPGNGCLISVRAIAPNPFAAGTKLECFHAGDMGKPDARPFRTATIQPDGQPVQVCTAQETHFDLRAVFSGKDGKTVELKSVEAKGRWTLTADGKLEAVKK